MGISSDDLTVNIYFKGLFTVTSVLGAFPNILIIILFFKRNPKEIYSYSVFLLSFAVTELICAATTFLTMDRSVIVSFKEIWTVPIGPCNWISTIFCEYCTVIQRGCTLYVTTLIPVSFIYRYYVLSHGAPTPRNVVCIVVIASILPIVSIPLNYSTVVVDSTWTSHYHFFRFITESIVAKVVNLYSLLLSVAFLTNFIFGWLILRKLRKYTSFMAPQTIKVHRMLTRALIYHTFIQWLLFSNIAIFYLEAAQILIFPYCDVLPTFITSIIPLLNGMICLFCVPYYRKILRRGLRQNSQTSNRNIFLPLQSVTRF